MSSNDSAASKTKSSQMFSGLFPLMVLGILILIVTTTLMVWGVFYWSCTQVEKIENARFSEVQSDLWGALKEEWAKSAKQAVAEAVMRPGVLEAVVDSDRSALLEQLDTYYNYISKQASIEKWRVYDRSAIPIVSIDNPSVSLSTSPHHIGEENLLDLKSNCLKYDRNGRLVSVMPIYNRQGELSGWMCLSSNISALVGQLGKMMDRPVFFRGQQGQEYYSEIENAYIFDQVSDLSVGAGYTQSANKLYKFHSSSCPVGQFLVAYDVTEAVQSRERVLIFSSLILAAALFGLVWLAVVVLRRRFKRLQCLKEAMSDFNPNNKTHSSLVPQGNDEIAELITEFNEVSEFILAQWKLLETAQSEAENANQAKSDFLANMSHEIRTPMTAILGFAENLMDSSLSEKEHLECVATIRRNGESLLGIINDILDLSKLESGKFEIESIDCEVCSVIADVVSLMHAQAKSKGINFSVEYSGPVPKVIQSDPIRLRQILINLIGNAIKFTEKGSIRLVTSFIEQGDSSQIAFMLIDTGCGMSPKQAARLFQPFMQADSSTTRNYGGTGLGLTISKKFAELLGGDLVVASSEVGVGSTFRASITAGNPESLRMLTDPTAATVVRSESDANELYRTKRLDDYNVLLAEDGKDNQRLISHLLKKAGAEVTVVENGKLALEAALQAERNGQAFDCVLMDMQMPVMDGYEATQGLRAEGYTGPVIALTANAMVSDKQKCLNAGCSDFQTKPIKRKLLIEAIRKAAELRNEPEVEQGY